MATIYPLHFTKADLKNVPADELMLFLLTGHATNDVQILQRLMIMALNSLDQDKHANLPALAQALLLTRTLTTRVAASWDEIGKRKYQILLDRAEETISAGEEVAEVTLCREARLTLNEALADGSMLVRIRNKTGAHTDRKTLRDAFDKTPDDYEFINILSEIHGNTVHGAADDIAMQALLGTTTQANSEAQIKELGGILVSATKAIGEVANLWSMYFYREYLLDNLKAAQKSRIKAKGSADITKVSLPVFLELPAGRGAAS